MLIVRTGPGLDATSWNDSTDTATSITSGVESQTTKHGYVDPDEPMSVIQKVFRAATDQKGKRQEIGKAKEEINRRIENGYYPGNPPRGLAFDENKRYLVPGDEFRRVREGFRLRDEDDLSYRKIADPPVSQNQRFRVSSRAVRYMRMLPNAER